MTSPRITAKSLNSSQSTGPSVSPREASPVLIGPVRPSSQASEKLRMIGLMTNGTASRNRKTWLVRARDPVAQEPGDRIGDEEADHGHDQRRHEALLEHREPDAREERLVGRESECRLELEPGALPEAQHPGERERHEQEHGDERNGGRQKAVASHPPHRPHRAALPVRSVAALRHAARNRAHSSSYASMWVGQRCCHVPGISNLPFTMAWIFSTSAAWSAPNSSGCERA